MRARSIGRAISACKGPPDAVLMASRWRLSTLFCAVAWAATRPLASRFCGVSHRRRSKIRSRGCLPVICSIGWRASRLHDSVRGCPITFYSRSVAVTLQRLSLNWLTESGEKIMETERYLMDELEAGEAAVELDSQEPQEVLGWALEKFGRQVGICSSFQAE